MNGIFDQSFNIVTTGRILAGFERAQVESSLSSKLKIDALQSVEMLSGIVVIKENVPKIVADRYVKNLKSLGLDAVVVSSSADLSNRLKYTLQNGHADSNLNPQGNDQNKVTQTLSDRRTTITIWIVLAVSGAGLSWYALG